MEESKLIRDIDIQIRNLCEVKVFIDKVYYNSDLTKTVNRTFLSYLTEATNFLINNLEIAKNDFLRAGG